MAQKRTTRKTSRKSTATKSKRATKVLVGINLKL